jgi:Tfp pilus assembly protein PilF
VIKAYVFWHAKFFSAGVCLCFSLALSVLPARALDTAQQQDTQSLSHYIAAVYYEGRGDFESAVAEYHKAITADPQSSLLHLYLASAFIQKGDFEQAGEELRQTVDLDPENIDVYKGLGAIYLQQQKFKQAGSIFKLLLGLDSRDAQSHFYLGDICYELGDYPAAEKELKAALKLRPDYHEGLNFLGYFYLEQDKFIDQAGALIKRALALEPENGAYLDSLGWFYYKKGNFKQALDYLEQAAAVLSDPEVHDHLGDTYLKLNNPGSAKLNWEKSLQLDPQAAGVSEKLRKLTNYGK